MKARRSAGGSALRVKASRVDSARFVCVFVPLFLVAAGAIPEGPTESIGFAEAARLAVEASAELKAEEAQLALRRGAWALGIRDFLPRVSFGAAEDDRLSAAGPDSFRKNYTVSVKQLVWDGGRLGTARAVEAAKLRSAADELRRKAESIEDAAIAAYRDVLSARALLSIREGARDALEEQRRILGEEAARGLATAFEAEEAELAAKGARLEAEVLALELEETQALFVEMLGLRSLPVLAETVDVLRSPVLPMEESAAYRALALSPELVAARSSLGVRRAEAKAASEAWLPSIKANVDFGVSGESYPLTQGNWSFGLTAEFATPWLSGSVGGNVSWEPPHDRAASLRSSAEPAPNPAGAASARSAALALELETKNMALLEARAARRAAAAVRSCAIADRKRAAAVEARDLAASALVLAGKKAELGHATRIDLMKARSAWAEREAAAVRAAVAVLAAERALERSLDLPPGGLADFAARKWKREGVSWNEGK